MQGLNKKGRRTCRKREKKEWGRERMSLSEIRGVVTARQKERLSRGGSWWRLIDWSFHQSLPVNAAYRCNQRRRERETLDFQPSPFLTSAFRKKTQGRWPVLHSPLPRSFRTLDMQMTDQLLKWPNYRRLGNDISLSLTFRRVPIATRS